MYAELVLITLIPFREECSHSDGWKAVAYSAVCRMPRVVFNGNFLAPNGEIASDLN